MRDAAYPEIQATTAPDTDSLQRSLSRRSPVTKYDPGRKLAVCPLTRGFPCTDSGTLLQASNHYRDDKSQSLPARLKGN